MNNHVWNRIPAARAPHRLGILALSVGLLLAALGLNPAPGVQLTGDLGVTFGNPEGNDTVLRSYWSNQATGLVADEVFELKLEPRNWGRLKFE